MEHHTPHFTTSVYTFFVLMFCGGLLIACTLPQLTKARGSYLIRNDRGIMLFRKPLPLRRTLLAIAGFTFLIFLNTVFVASEGRNPLLGYFICVVPLILPVIFLYASGPNDIRLDGSQRTFEWTVGFPWNPVTQFGTFDDIKGISVSLQDGIELVMEKPGALSRSVNLCNSGTKAAAEALVEDLRREYGFAVVPYPKK